MTPYQKWLEEKGYDMLPDEEPQEPEREEIIYEPINTLEYE